LAKAAFSHGVDVVVYILETRRTSPYMRGLALERAARAGKEANLSVLLAAGVDQFSRQHALYSAARFRRVGAVRMLVAAGAILDTTVLKGAVVGGSNAVLGLLIAHGDWLRGVGDSRSHLLTAAVHGHWETLRELLLWDKIALPPDFRQGALLDTAAASGRLNVVENLIGFVGQAGVLHTLSLEVHGGNALLAAAANGRKAVVQWLVGAGVPATYHGGRALVECAGTGDVEMMEFLLSSGVPANCDNGEALVAACGGGRYFNVRLLLAAGVRADVQQGKALVAACESGNERIVELLLSQRNHAARADSLRGAGLVAACRSGHLTVVRMLVGWCRNAPCPYANGGEAICAAKPWAPILAFLKTSLKVKRNAALMVERRRAAGTIIRKARLRYWARRDQACD